MAEENLTINVTILPENKVVTVQLSKNQKISDLRTKLSQELKFDEVNNCEIEFTTTSSKRKLRDTITLRNLPKSQGEVREVLVHPKIRVSIDGVKICVFADYTIEKTLIDGENRGKLNLILKQCATYEFFYTTSEGEKKYLDVKKSWLENGISGFVKVEKASLPEEVKINYDERDDFLVKKITSQTTVGDIKEFLTQEDQSVFPTKKSVHLKIDETLLEDDDSFVLDEIRDSNTTNISAFNPYVIPGYIILDQNSNEELTRVGRSYFEEPVTVKSFVSFVYDEADQLRDREIISITCGSKQYAYTNEQEGEIQLDCPKNEDIKIIVSSPVVLRVQLNFQKELTDQTVIEMHGLNLRTKVADIKTWVTRKNPYLFPDATLVKILDPNDSSKELNDEDLVSDVLVDLEQKQLQVVRRFLIKLIIREQEGQTKYSFYPFPKNPTTDDINYLVRAMYPQQKIQKATCPDDQSELVLSKNTAIPNDCREITVVLENEQIATPPREEAAEKAQEIVRSATLTTTTPVTTGVAISNLNPETQEITFIYRPSNVPVTYTVKKEGTTIADLKKIIYTESDKRQGFGVGFVPSIKSIVLYERLNGVKNYFDNETDQVSKYISDAENPYYFLSYKILIKVTFPNWLQKREFAGEFEIHQSLKDVKGKISQHIGYEGPFNLRRDESILSNLTKTLFDYRFNETQQLLLSFPEVTLRFRYRNKTKTEKFTLDSTLRNIKTKVKNLFKFPNIVGISLRVAEKFLEGNTLWELRQHIEKTIDVERKISFQALALDETGKTKQELFLSEDISAFTVEQVKKELASALNVPESRLRSYDNYPDNKTLEEIGVKDGGVIKFVLASDGTKKSSSSEPPKPRVSQVAPSAKKPPSSTVVAPSVIAPPVKLEEKQLPQTQKSTPQTPSGVPLPKPITKEQEQVTPKLEKPSRAKEKISLTQISRDTGLSYKESILNKQHPELRTDWAQFLPEIASESEGRKYRQVSTLFTFLKSLSKSISETVDVKNWDTLLRVCVWFEHNFQSEKTQPQKELAFSLVIKIYNHIIRNKAAWKSQTSTYIRDNFISPLRVLSKYHVLFQCGTTEHGGKFDDVFSTFCKHIDRVGPKGSTLENPAVRDYRCEFFWAKLQESLSEAHEVLAYVGKHIKFRFCSIKRVFQNFDATLPGFTFDFDSSSRMKQKYGGPEETIEQFLMRNDCQLGKILKSNDFQDFFARCFEDETCLEKFMREMVTSDSKCTGFEFSSSLDRVMLSNLKEDVNELYLGAESVKMRFSHEFVYDTFAKLYCLRNISPDEKSPRARRSTGGTKGQKSIASLAVSLIS